MIINIRLKLDDDIIEAARYDTELMTISPEDMKKWIKGLAESRAIQVMSSQVNNEDIVPVTLKFCNDYYKMLKFLKTMNSVPPELQSIISANNHGVNDII